MTKDRTRRKVIIAAGITILFWSSAFAGIRVGLSGYDPLELTLLRFLWASAVFAVYAFIRGIPVPRRDDLPRLVFLGLIGITIYHTALNLGEVSVPAGTASLIIATAPVFTALLSRFLLKEVFRPVGWCGILLSFIGVAIMTGKGNGDLAFTRGALLILLSSICTSIYFVGQKPLFARYTPIQLTAYVTWAGTIPLLLFLPDLGVQIRHAPLEATLAVVYIGIFPAAVAYAAWSMILKELSPGQAASLLYINPPLAIFFGFIWLGEVPNIQQLLGGVLALAGVIIVNKWAKKPKGRSDSTGNNRHQSYDPSNNPYS